VFTYTPVQSKAYTYIHVLLKVFTYTPVLSKAYSYTPVLSKAYTYTPVLSKAYSYTNVLPKVYTYTPVLSKVYTDTPVLSKVYTYTPVLSNPRLSPTVKLQRIVICGSSVLQVCPPLMLAHQQINESEITHTRCWQGMRGGGTSGETEGALLTARGRGKPLGDSKRYGHISVL
jgi:hypothetical protein